MPTRILREEVPFYGVNVKAASLGGLVSSCLNEILPTGLVTEDCFVTKAFFRTYQWHTSPEDLLKYFVDLYESAQEVKDRTKIYFLVKYWLDHHGNDVQGSDSAMSALSELNRCVTNKAENGFSAVLTLDNWNAEQTFESVRVMSTSKRQLSLNFHDLEPTDLAEQLVYLNWKGMNKIPFTEWKRHTKDGKTSAETARLKKQISFCNNVSRYVQAMVLSKATPEERCKSIKKFIAVGQELQRLGDFSMFLSVMGGLGHSTINRLHKTKELLSQEDKLFLKEASDLLSSKGNYSKYRAYVESQDDYVAPILGVVMKDLIALDTAQPDYVDDNGVRLINFYKMVVLSNALRLVYRMKATAPEVQPHKELSNMLRVSLKPRYTEDDLYELSLQWEPRTNVARTPSTPGEEGDVFAFWAAGVDETPDRATVEKHVNAMVEAVFKLYDMDKNGYISQDEFDAIATNFPFIDSFSVLDANCDGSISRQEMMNYFMNVNSQEMTREFIHNFQEQTFFAPTYCVYCMGFLWGIGKVGFKCKDCGIACHKDCKNHVVMECHIGSRNLSSKSDKPPTKLKKKRLNQQDPAWKGSTDSQLSEVDVPATPPTQRNQSWNVSSTRSLDRHSPAEIKMRERIIVLEREKMQLNRQIEELKRNLAAAEATIDALNTQTSAMRQQSMKFLLAQFEKLNSVKQTDV